MKISEGFLIRVISVQLNGRAAVSKTARSGFDSYHRCQFGVADGSDLGLISLKRKFNSFLHHQKKLLTLCSKAVILESTRDEAIVSISQLFEQFSFCPSLCDDGLEIEEILFSHVLEADDLCVRRMSGLIPPFSAVENRIWAQSMGSGDALQATRQRVRFPLGPPK